MRRLIKRIRFEGSKGIVHKSRGRSSNRRIPEEIREKVIVLYRERYPDFGPTLASEKLLEIDGIKISDETLRLWLLETGDWKKRRKHSVHRRWRERPVCVQRTGRKAYFGEMVQMDGSHHDWFEGRGESSVFMGYILKAEGV